MPGAVAEAAPTEDGGIARRIVLAWLSVFAGVEWLAIKMEKFGASKHWMDLLDDFSTLEAVEIALIARLLMRPNVGPPLGAAESLLILLGAAAVATIADARPIFALALIAFFALLRFWRHPASRVFAIALFLFSAQYWLKSGPFMWVHDSVAHVDAAIVRTFLRAIGAAVEGAGTMILTKEFSIHVANGCTSSFVAATVLPAFFILTLALRGAIDRAQISAALGLLICSIVLNWLRLAPMVSSRDGWLFWHEGAGAALIAAANDILVAYFVWRALYRAPASAVAAA
jgi:hypothetical protein